MLKPLSLEEIEKTTDNKYLAVCIASIRARQLSDGDKATIDIDAAKPSTIALHELAKGKLKYNFKEVGPPKEELEKVISESEEELAEGKTEFESIFKEEYVDDSGEEFYEDEEPEEGL